MRRIFELCAAGAGLTRIAKTLNAEGAPSPRPQQGRPTAWAPSSRARGAASAALPRARSSGTRRASAIPGAGSNSAGRPEAEWMRVPAPDLRIVSDELWQAAHAQAAERRTKHKGGDRWSRLLALPLIRLKSTRTVSQFVR